MFLCGPPWNSVKVLFFVTQSDTEAFDKLRLAQRDTEKNYFNSDKYRSASIAAIQPDPAAVTA